MPLDHEMLMKAEKPGRYIGNEINMVEKRIEDVRIRFSLCFPDVYEVGMSHLGLQLLYAYLNERPDVYCERCFAPWVDMEALMRESEVELFALETGDPIKIFDFIGFTLQYEMSFTNILNMLDLAGVELFSSERGEEGPIVCAGGPCACNPEPLAGFFDFFYIGEAEASLGSILDIYAQCKDSGLPKKDFLKRISNIRGVYVPSFYSASYNEDGTIASFEAVEEGAPGLIKKACLPDFTDPFQVLAPLVPLIEVIFDRVSVEAFRGCIRGCRFCQAGYLYRPVRERSVESLVKQAQAQLEATGHEEVSLLALSFSDYTSSVEAVDRLCGICTPMRVNLALPSLRIDQVSLGLMGKIQKVRKGSLTFAPEAGSQRLRDVINKGLSEEEILEGAEMAFRAGWSRMKLYFMVGLPSETEEDAKSIAALAERVVEKFFSIPKDQRSGSISINISSACFVPKPFTPFQWSAQNSYEDLMEKQRMIKKSIKKKQIQYNYHEGKLSAIEAVLARGDRKVGGAVFQAWKLGAKFEGWTERFKYDIWEEAFRLCGLDMDFYARRQRRFDEILPWDHIDIGVSKEFLIREMRKAEKAETTPNCRDGCGGCGFRKTGGGCVGE
ncbi:MAG: TIGR03960 family B12-binding radical SAM protein [Clostridiales bacterium]|jgi:radical SAM family uncharacterized protein|nr:TIGR03960 family B12-binding radical SAM protein [Clostridiales bacterium]